MKKIIILLFLTNLFSIVAMEEQPKRKFSEISEKPEKEKEKEKEHIPQCPIPRKRRKIEPRAVKVLPLREIAKRKTIEILGEAENAPEILKSIPAEEIQQEIQSHFRAEKLSYEESRLHNAHSELEVKRLLALGVDPNSKDRDGRTALNALINNGSLDAAFYLLTLKGKDLDVSSPDVYGATPLQRAIKRQDAQLATSIVEILSEQNELGLVYQSDSVGQSAFTLAIRYLPEIISKQTLLPNMKTKLIPLNPNLSDALTVATQYQPTLIKSLLDHGSNPNHKNSKGIRPLMYAAQYQPEAIQPLLDAGAKPNVASKKKRIRPLMYAARYQPKAVQPLLDAGAKPNAAASNGNTALMYAARYQPASIKLLLDAGAQVNAKNSWGATALMYAALYQPDAIQPLLAKGAEPNAQSEYGITALMHAAQFQPKSIQPLLAAGADPNILDSDGLSALTWAIRYNRLEVVKMLLDAGVKVTANDVHQAEGKFEIQKLLQEYFEKLFAN